MPTLSIILPVYNSETYLPTCLNSLFQQTFSDWEILAVNDGSTDRSLLVLQEYARQDPRLKVISIENSGVANARNTALKKATGDYLAFCDSDDVVPEKAYEKLVKTIRKSKAEAVIGGYADLDEWGEKNAFFPKGKNRFQDFFLVPCLWNRIFLRSFVQKNHLIFDSLTVGEDVVFLAKAYAVLQKITSVHSIVYVHCAHSSSLNHQFSFEYFQKHIRCREIFLQICRNYHISEGENYVFQQLSRFLLEFFYQAFQGEDKINIFNSLQNHLKQHNWSGQEAWFQAMFGVPPEKFWSLNACSFWTDSKLYDHRAWILREYRSGQIGLQYVFRFIKAWLQFKLGRDSNCLTK